MPQPIAPHAAFAETDAGPRWFSLLPPVAEEPAVASAAPRCMPRLLVALAARWASGCARVERAA